MCGAGEVIAAYVGRQRDIHVGARADQARRHAKVPELSRSEGLNDLRARVSRTTAVEHAGRGAAALHLRVILPPEDGLAARLRQRSGTAREREAEIGWRLPRGHVIVHAFHKRAYRLFLVEAPVQERY